MENDPLTVRRLTGGDAALAELLNALFAEVFEDPATYRAEPPGRDYLEQLLAKDDIIILVALADGEVVAGLVAYELAKLESRRREIYIYDLGVRETNRRQGLATALISQLQRIAREREAWVIFVQADYGDDPAIALYEQLGAREEVLHFDIGV